MDAQRNRSFHVFHIGPDALRPAGSGPYLGRAPGVLHSGGSSVRGLLLCFFFLSLSVVVVHPASPKFHPASPKFSGFGMASGFV